MKTAVPPRSERLGEEPAPLTAETRQLLRQIAQPMQGPRPLAFALALAGDYLILGAVIVAMVTFAWEPLFWVLLPVAWLIIAARQHAVLVLLHDATHGLAAQQRWLNELLGEWLCGAPMLVTMSKYRIDHLKHHRSMNGPEDPDWIRKLGDVDEAGYWVFPRRESISRFLGWSWLGSVRFLLQTFTHLSKSADKSSNSATVDSLQSWIKRGRIGIYLALVITLTWFGGWTLFALLWIAPMLLVLPMIMRLRSIAEHFALPNTHQLDATRNVRCGWLEGFFLAPHRVNYHLDHHLQAAVSFAELPRLHQCLLARQEYRDQAWINDGYFIGRHTLLDDMLGRNRATSPSNACTAQLPTFG